MGLTLSPLPGFFYFNTYLIPHWQHINILHCIFLHNYITGEVIVGSWILYVSLG